MGRGKRFLYAKYVKYDKASNISECLLCKRQMKSLSTGNIKRHYLKLHNANLDADTDSVQVQIKKIPSTNKPRLSINKNEFLTCCIGLVAVKNIPFRIFDDELYFKKLISPYEDEFQTNLNSKNIQEHLSGAVRDMRSLISEEIRNRMVCLKLDMVTRAERGVLAVNIQYMENFKITIQTIGMIEFHKNHSPKYLKTELRKCLSECHLDNSQVYSTTTDKGSNVYLQETQEDSDDVSDVNEWEKEYESIHSSFLGVVKCASDTIHLAANYVMSTMNENITECRKIIRTLQVVCRNTGIQVPALDTPSQWISTYHMIDSLLELKPTIDELEEKIDIKWHFATEFIDAFKPLVECVKKVHEVNYIIGDFFRDWLCCEIELEEISDKNSFANALLKSMKTRKELLLDNEAFISALYIDPRFNFIKTPFLTDDQKQKALKNLQKTVANLKRLDEKDDASSSDGERSSFEVSSIVSLNPFGKLEEKTKTLIGSTSAATGKSVTEKLEGLKFSDRLTFDTDILNHWRCLTYEDPEMRKLVEVVLASPCTQVSVERTLREFSRIVSNPGCTLSNKTVNNMLMIKLNSNILRDINLDVRTDEDTEMT